MKLFRPLRHHAARIEPLEARIAPASFVVTTIADTGAGSLRQAILDANAAPNGGGPDVISFNIASGPFVIQPVTPLPVISEAVIIDGYTQLNATPNTLAVGTDANIVIGLSGSLLPAGNGLIITGGGSKVRGLAIFGFAPGINESGSGIILKSSNNSIEGNFIGTGTNGVVSVATENKNSGVRVGDFLTNNQTFSGNIIGGLNPADRNLFAGNIFGVAVDEEGLNTMILGNLIGTDKTGLLAQGNTNAGIADGGTGTTIGNGTNAGRNVISGNDNWGIVTGTSTGIVVRGNYIGVNATGTAALGNLGPGILANYSATGGLIEGNVISGNGNDGIQLGSPVFDGDARNFNVRGNFIGTNAAGSLPVPNTGAGVAFYTGSAGNTIGGMTGGDGNTIAFNVGAGIQDLEGGANRFLGNSIRDNGELGIDLANQTSSGNFFGVSPNDSPDVDGIANFPVIATFNNDGTTVTLTGNYAGVPNATVRLEFFAVAPSQIDLSGQGEGAVFLGFRDVTTNASGTATFTFSEAISLPGNTAFTATATTGGRTSEFGPAKGAATVYTWFGVNGSNWENPLNWTPNGVPGALDTAIYGGAGNALVLTKEVSVRQFEHTGGVVGGTGAGELNILTTLSWTNGTHSGGTLRLIEGSTSAIGTAAAHVWTGGSLEIHGTLIVQGSGLNFNQGDLFVEAGGFLQLNAGITDADGAGTVVTASNFGSIEKFFSGAFGLANISLTNFGTVVSRNGGNFTVGGFTQTDGALELAISDFTSATGIFLGGGVLRGNGTITGNVTNDSATIRPGGFASTGTINVAGNYTQNSTGRLSIEIAGVGSHDLIIVTGNASLNGELQHSVLGNFTVRVDDTFLVLDAATRSGTFASVTGLRPLTEQYSAGEVSLEARGFIVENTDDSGPGSLRQAILDANAQPGLDYISFDILAAGVQTISPLTPLPMITGDVVIDAYSQPGAARNTLGTGSNAVLSIELSGAASTPGRGLDVFSGKAYISGFIINGWSSNAGIALSNNADGSTIVGNWIGLNSAGTAGSANQTGLQLTDAASVRIGTGDPRDRNVISGNTNVGVGIVGTGATGNIIQGNYIGTTKTGGAALGNFIGIATSGDSTIIGGANPGEGNVISGSTTSAGVQIGSGGGANSIVQGNLIGTDATGTLDLGNATNGILVRATNVLVGGDVPGAGNVISGNGASGLVILGAGASGAIVYGNKIGTAINGISQIANNGSGVLIIDASNAVIGGEFPGQGNIIALNGVDGVIVDEQGGTALGNSIRGNSIFSNSRRGINLSDPSDPANVVTPNDANDADTGPNGLLNFPVLTSFTAGVLSGTYHGLANTGLTLDIYSDTAADPSGNGEGRTLIATTFINTDGSGNAAFSVPGLGIASGFITATATRNSTGDTSEFSNAIAPGGLTYVWDNSAANGDWFNPLNWDLDSGVPGAADTAILNFASTINLTGNASVGAFQQSNGTFTSPAGITFTVVNAFDWTGGTQDGTGTTTVAGGGTLTISGAGAKGLSVRTLTNNGTANFSGGDLGFSGVGTFTNNGDFNATDGASFVNVSGSGILRNSATGTFNKTGAGTTTEVGANVAFENAGTVNVTSGSLRLGGGGASSGGTFSIGAGTTLEFSGGTATLAAAATVTGAGNVSFTGGTAAIDGTYSITGATMVSGTAIFGGTATLASLDLLSGTLGGSGSVTVTGALNWTGGTMSDTGTTTVAGGGTLTISGAGVKGLSVRDLINEGTGSLSGADLGFISAGTFTNNGVFNATGGASFVNVSGSGVVINGATGTFNKTGAGTTTVGPAVTFNNAGTVNITTGTLELIAGGSSSGGTITVGGAGILAFDGGTHTFGAAAAFAGTGAVNFASGTTNIDGAYAVTGLTSIVGTGIANFNGTATIPALNLAGTGMLGGSGSVTVTGALNWTGGTMSDAGTTTVAGGGTLTISGAGVKGLSVRDLINEGTGSLSGADLGFISAGTFTNNGVFNATGGASFVNVSGSGVVINGATGTFNKTGAGTTTTVGPAVTFNNAGAINATSGTLAFAGGFTQTAGSTVLGGGGISTGSTLAFQGGELRGAGTIAGNVDNTGATVRPGGTGSAGTLTITGAYTQGAGGTLAVELGGTGAGQFDVLAAGSGTTVDGTLNIANISAFTPTAGNTFRVVQSAGNPTTFAAVTGAAAGLSQSADATGLVLTADALTFIWDNSAGTNDWFNPLNWDRDSGVPGAADTAVLNISSTINLPGNASVGTFQQSNGAFASPTGVTFTVLNSFAWSGGVQSGAGTAATTLAAGSFSSISGTALKTIAGRAFNVGGTLTWSGTGNIALNSGNFLVQNTGVFDLQSDAALGDADGGATAAGLFVTGLMKKSAGTGTSAMGGNLGSGTGTIAVQVNTVGTLRVESGTMQFDGALHNIGNVDALTNTVVLAAGNGIERGTFHADAGGVVRVTGGIQTLDTGSAFTGAGRFDIAGGRVDLANGVNVSATNVSVSDTLSRLVLSGSLTVTQSFDWTGGTAGGVGNLILAAGSVSTIGGAAVKTWNTGNLSVIGTLTWSGTGTLDFAGGGALTVNAGALFDLQSDATFGNSAAGFNASILIDGILRKSAGAGTSRIDGTPGTVATFVSATGRVEVLGGTLAIADFFGNAGTMSALGGTIEIAALADTDTGNYNAATGARVLFSGGTRTLDPGAALTGPGLFEIGGGSGLVLNTNIAVQNLAWNGGTIGGANALNVAALTIATVAPKTLSAATVNLSGLATWTGAGSLTLTQGAVVNIENGATFDIRNVAAINYNNVGAAPAINNAGTYQQTAGGNTATIGSGIVFTNTGTVRAATGALAFNGGFTQSAGSTVLAGGDLETTGTFNFIGGELRGGGQITGTVNNSGAIVRPGGTGAAAALSIAGAYTQGPGGTLAIEVGGATPALFDRLGASLGLTIGGTLTTTLINGFTPLGGAQFGAIGGDPRIGTFATVNGPLTAQYNADNVTLLAPGATTYTWDAGAGGNTSWFAAANWSPDGVPGAADTAILNIASTINLTGNTSVGTFQQSSGTLGGAGMLTVLTSFAWSGGTVNNTLRNEGAATFSAASFLGGTIENAGTFTHSGGVLSFVFGGTFENLPGALYSATTGPQVLFGNFNGGSGNLFQNEGIFRRDGAGIARLEEVPLLNKAGGEIEVLNGTLQLNTTGTLEGGFFDVRAGAAVSFDFANLALTGTISGAGVVRFDVGRIVGSAAATLNFPSGVFEFGGSAALDGTVLNTGFVQITDGAPGFGRNGDLGMGVLNNAGTIVQTGGVVNVFFGSTINNLAGATYDLRAGAGIAVNAGNGSSGNVFNNAGTLVRNGAGVADFSGVAVTNSGTVDLQGGALGFLGGFAQTAGSTQFNGGVIGGTSGTMHNFQGGELRGTGSIGGSVSNTGATIRPGGTGAAGALAIGGTYTQGAGGTLAIEVGGATPALFDRLGASLGLTIGGTLTTTLINGFTPLGGAQFGAIGGDPRIGTFATVTGPLTAQYNADNVTLLAPGATTYTWDAGAGGNTSWFAAANWSPDGVPGAADTAILNINAGIDLSAGNASVASFQQTNGTLTGGSTLTVTGNFVWTGGTESGAGATTLANGGSGTIGGTIAISSRTLNNAGTLVWTTGGALTATGSPAFNNLATGTLDLRADGAIQFGGSGGNILFTNAGTVQKTAGAGAFTFATGNFVNTGTVRAASGTINFPDAVAAGGTFEATTGALTLTGTTTIAPNVTFNAVEFAGGSMAGTGTVAGSWTWSGGTLGGGGVLTIPATGVLTLTGPAPKSLTNYTVTNNGTVNFTGGNLVSTSSPTFNNASGGIFDIQTDASLIFGGSGGNLVFNNDGLVRKTAGAGTTTMELLNFVNNGGGTVRAQTGALNFTTAIAAGGSFTAAGGAIVLTGTATLATNVAFNGVELAGGVIRGTGTVAGSWTWSSGTLGGDSGVLTIPTTGVLTLTGPAPKSLTNYTVTNNGTVNFTGGGDLVSTGSPTFNNAGGGVFDIQTDADVIFGGSGGNLTFNNDGLLRKTAGAGTTTMELLNFVNNGGGTVLAQTGALNFTAAIAAGGTFTAAGGAITLMGTTTLATNVAFNGVELAGGTLRGTGTVTGNWKWSSGTLGGGGVLTIPTGGVLTPTGSANKVLSNYTVTNNGTVNFTGAGNLVSTGSPTFNNAGGGIFDIQTDADVVFGGSGGNLTFNNDGLVRKTVGAGTTNIATGTFVNNATGVILAQSGTIDFPNALTAGGTLTAPVGGAITLTGTTTLATNVAFNGVELAGGVIRGTGTVAGSWTWSSGTLGGDGGALTIPAGGVLTLMGSANKALTNYTVTNNGTVNFTGAGNLVSTGSPTFNNAGGGIFDIQTDAGLVFGGSGGNLAFNNAGTLRKAVGGGTSAVSGAFTNTGTVLSQTGALSFTDFTQTAGSTVLGGGALGSGSVFAFQGGALNGAGTITGSVSNTGATVRPGGAGAAGTLTVTGAYTQGAGGTLAVELGGTGAGAFDVLNVSGAATLGGTLNIAHLAGFTPASGNTFRVVQSAGNPGTFATLNGLSGGKTQTADATGLVLAQAVGGTFTWDAGAGADTSWFNPLNWSPDGVPGATDTAVLTINATINLPSAATVGAFNQSSGVFRGGGTLTITSASNWSGGIFNDGGKTVIAAGATLTLSSVVEHYTDVHDFEIAGTVIHSGTGQFRSNNNGDITILPGGLYDLQTDADFFGNFGNGNAAINNQGTFRKSGGSGVTFVNADGATYAFNNTGTIEVQSGTLQFQDSGTQSGTFNVAGGALMQFNAGQTFNTGTQFLGAGENRLAGGVSALNGAITTQNLVLAGGGISGTHTLTGTFEWRGGTLGNFFNPGTTTIPAGSTMTLTSATDHVLNAQELALSGTLLHTGAGNLRGVDSPVVNVLSGGLYDLRSDGDFQVNGGDGTMTLNNAGTFRKSVATGTSVTGGLPNTVPFNNTGTVEVQSGTLSFPQPFTQTAGATVLNGGSLGGATLNFQGGELRGSGTITGNVSNTGATVRPGGAGAAGTISITGTYTQGAGGTLASELGGTGAGQFDVLAVSGNATLDGVLDAPLLGGFTLPNGSQFSVITTGGSIVGTFATPPAGVGIQYAANAVRLLGPASPILTWDAGGGADTSWFNPLNWNTDTLPGPTDNAVLDTNATITLNTTNVTVNAFTLSAGTLTGNATLSITTNFAWTGGAMTGSGNTTIAPGATADLNGPTDRQLTGRTLENKGDLTWSGPGQLVLSAAQILNQGTFTLADDVVIAVSTPSTFENQTGATLTKSAGGGTAVISIGVAVTNMGTIESAAGVLDLGNSFVQVDGALVLGGGNFATPGALVLNGGVLAGSGHVFGNLSNVAGVVSPGNSPGQIVINGDFAQGPAGVLNFEIEGVNPGEFDTLTVTGTATLDGTVNVFPINGFVPVGGTIFTLITAGAIVGSFANGNAPGFFLFEGATEFGVIAGSFEVSNADDSGPGSLRDAILAANVIGGGGTADTITFNIPGAGPFNIALASALPTITDSIIIDGYTQPGAAFNESGIGIDATLLIVLDGSGAGVGADGLHLLLGSSTVRGLVIGGFDGAGIRIEDAGNVIAGNFIGTDASGTAAFGNTTGIIVTSANNTIGGNTSAERNLISGNSSASGALNAGAGIVLDGAGAGSNTILNNYIGTDATGNSPLANSKSGVGIYGGAHDNLVGGTTPLHRNIVSGNFGHGVDIAFSSNDNAVGENFIGIGADGFTALGNAGAGVLINFGSSGNIIGGDEGGENVISANVGGGVVVSSGSANNVILGNLIGTSADGTMSLTNNLYGVVLGAAGGGNIVGGNSPGARNRISGGGGDGVRIENGTTLTIVQGNTIGLRPDGVPYGDTGYGVKIVDGSNNTIGGFGQFEGNVIANDRIGVAVIGNASTGNRIVGNTFISGVDTPIDLGDDEDDDNDAGDTDSGPNQRQNYPVITGANVSGSDLAVVGSLDTQPGTYTVQLYRSGTTSDFGHGDGAPFATFSITVGTGVQSFARTISGAGVGLAEFVSAIVVNDFTGDTSEFSLAIAAAGANGTIVDKKTPLTFTDADGDTVKVTLKGNGSLEVLLQGGVLDDADIASIALSNTDLKSKLTVEVVKTRDVDRNFSTTVGSIFTIGTQQHMGEVIFRGDITLGNGVADSAPDLLISGKTNKLSLGDLAANTFIKLGRDLPYDEPGNKVPDTRNNEPTLSVGDVLGAGVNIEVLGDGTPAGIGGGGFQSVTFNSWAFDGFLRTTQGIGKFLIKTGDFFGVLEVDKFRNGEQTTANVGSMIVAEGAWGSSGSEIEGNIGSFDVQAFAAGATITAGSMGRVKSAGELAGTFILTDPDAGGVPTFTVNSDFSARIISAVSIKKLKIKGDFTGSLEAPSIGSISAFSFLGTMGATEIVANAGKLGTLKSTTGVFRDYAIVTDEAFSGISVKARKLGADTVGIENVSITAASIGKITVDLAADSRSAGVSLTGIRDSEFITTATGTAKGTQGSIANVTVKLKGGAGGDGTGMENVTLDARVLAGEFGAGTPASTANPLGNLSVKVSGFGGASAGIVNGDFHGDTIGKTSVSVTRGGSGTARGVDGVIYTATGAIGAMKFGGDVTQNMIANLQVLAGGKLAGLNVAAKDSALGSIVDSAILAGQSLALTGGEKEQKAALSAASLGAVKIAGSLIGTRLVAGANIGGITVGGTATDSLILAGAMLGGDFTLGDGNETFQRAAAVSGVTVKGAFTRSSIVAGIASTNATFGDADDALAAVAGTLAQSSSIGAVKLGSGSGTNATGPAIAHDFAIQAAAIKSLANEGSSAVKDFAAALYLDAAPAGENADDVLVRVL